MTTGAVSCCRCDPTTCAEDDTGEHCMDMACAPCLYGCPAIDLPCCGLVDHLPVSS